MTAFIDPTNYTANQVPKTSGAAPLNFNLNVLDPIRAINDLLEGTEEYGKSYYLKTGAGAYDFKVKLGDDGGAQSFSLEDSGAVEVFAVNSDGDLSLSGQLGTLDAVGNPDGDKTFTMANKSLIFTWAAPTAVGIEFDATGGFTGDLVHIHQHGGNPGATDLVHIEAEDADVILLHLTHGIDAASICLARYEGDRATPTNGDEIFFSYFLSDDGSNQTEFGRMTIKGTDVGAAAEDGKFIFSVIVNTSLTEVMSVDAAGQFALPIQGSGAGILIGTDVQLYQGAAHRLDLASGDSLLITDAMLAIGDGSAITTDRYIDVDGSLTGAATWGVISTPSTATGGATLTPIAARGDVDAGVAATTVNALRIMNAVLGGGASLTNQFGILIDSLSGATTNRAIYIGGTGGLLGAISWNGDTELYRSAANTLALASGDSLDIISGSITVGGPAEIDGDLNHDGSNIGFFGTAPAAKQTGVAVTEAAIHAALVAYGLIAGP